MKMGAQLASFQASLFYSSSISIPSKCTTQLGTEAFPTYNCPEGLTILPNGCEVRDYSKKLNCFFLKLLIFNTTHSKVTSEYQISLLSWGIFLVIFLFELDYICLWSLSNLPLVKRMLSFYHISFCLFVCFPLGKKKNETVKILLFFIIFF